MANPTRTTNARNIEKRTHTKASSSKTDPKERSADELIVTLSDAHENRRARQVLEWESVQPMNVQRAI